MKHALVTLAFLILASGTAAAGDDLTGGVMFLHKCPQIDLTAEFTCEDDFDLQDCQDQVNQTPLNDTWPTVFFIVSGFADTKSFLAVEYGLEYESDVLGYVSYQNCIPQGNEALEIPYGTFPEPGSGIAIALIDEELPWTGSLVATSAIMGYTYADGVVSLTANPQTGMVGWANTTFEGFQAVCLGKLGIGIGQGEACCPEPTPACCFTNGDCIPLTAGDCEAAGGVPYVGASCEPNPCPPPVPAAPETWGAVKTRYR